MIYLETRAVTPESLKSAGEERIYKDMLNSLIEMMPMHKLKEIFPVSINDNDMNYVFQIRVEK